MNYITVPDVGNGRLRVKLRGLRGCVWHWSVDLKHLIGRAIVEIGQRLVAAGDVLFVGGQHRTATLCILNISLI